MEACYSHSTAARCSTAARRPPPQGPSLFGAAAAPRLPVRCSPTPSLLRMRGVSPGPPAASRLAAEAEQQQQAQSPAPPSVGVETAERETSPGGTPGPSGDPDGGPSGGPNGGPGPGPGDGSSSGLDTVRLRYWLVLLVEYGGLYGTAAVVLSALTGVPAFGGLHWDSGDMALGLALMAPALAMDALVGLPDWSTRRQEDSDRLLRLFVDPDLLKARTATAAAMGGDGDGKAAVPSAAAAAASAATDSPALVPATGMASSTASSSADAVASTSGSAAPPSGDGGPPSALWAAGQRLRMALELMQETSVRNNPGARLTLLQELAVILVAVAAEEMLYRAVVLTLVGRWLRDRFYEAGAEETMLLGAGLGGSGSGGVEVDTATAALWAALALGCTLGTAVFACRAWQETTNASRLRKVQQAEREAAEKQLRKQRLGQHISAEEVRLKQERQARVEAAQTMLASSIGVQGALVWILEGTREVYQVAAAGAAFILTGNLAAPVAGALAAQVLSSTYQRLGLQRNIQRRAEVILARRLQKERKEKDEREAAQPQQQPADVAAGTDTGAENN